MALERVINTSSPTRSSVRKRLAAPTVASTGSDDAVKLSVPLAINSPTGGMVVDLGILDANGGGFAVPDLVLCFRSACALRIR